MKNALKIIAGIGLGIIACEIGMRLYFNEYEALGRYTSRFANIADSQLGFRFSPNTSVVCGRENIIPGSTITSNKYGFRDEKDYRRPSGCPVIGVYGASYMFGLGISRNEDMFYNRLNNELVDNYDWPESLEVYNISGIGYTANQIEKLVELTVDDLNPNIVLFVTYPIRIFFDPGKYDIVDGVHFLANRFAAGTFIDKLRTHSYIYMRSVKSPLLSSIFSAEPIDPEQKAAQWDYTNKLHAEIISRLNSKLAAKGIIMAVVLVKQYDEQLVSLFQQAGLNYIYVEVEKDYLFNGDYHWNVAGNEKAAQLVASFSDSLARKAGLVRENVDLGPEVAEAQR